MATFLGPAFAASRVQHLSDLHSKSAWPERWLDDKGAWPGCHVTAVDQSKIYVTELSMFTLLRQVVHSTCG